MTTNNYVIILILHFILLLVIGCDAFRLIDYELQPLTASGTEPFICTDSTAFAIETSAERCLMNRCAEYVIEVGFGYSNCTESNGIRISGGLSDVVDGTSDDNTSSADTCIKNTLESDVCKQLFLVDIPNLLSMTVSNKVPAPSVAPVASPPSSLIPAAPIIAPVASPTFPSIPVASPTSAPTPTLAPTILIVEAPVLAPIVSTQKPVNLPATSTPVNTPTSVSTNPVISSLSPTTLKSAGSNSSESENAALTAVYALSAVTAVLLGFLIFYFSKRKYVTTKSDRGPLDTTDTALDNEDDTELGNQPPTIQLYSNSDTPYDFERLTTDAISKMVDDKVALKKKKNTARQLEFINDSSPYMNHDNVVPEDDELSSDSSTLFDVNGNGGDGEDDDAESSMYYESQGEEDDEEGTELDLDETLQSSFRSQQLNMDNDKVGNDDDVDNESIQQSTISSLGASADNFGENTSSHKLMEWIKKSPLIPAEAKASVVAAVAAEVIEKRSSPPSPATVPISPTTTKSWSDDTSGRQSW